MLPRDYADRRWIHRGGFIGRQIRRIRAQIAALISNLGSSFDWHGPF
jgi:hypothetical protein